MPAEQASIQRTERQGGIFPGNLGTRFPRNPWSQAKYLLEITIFLFDIESQNIYGGNQPSNNTERIPKQVIVV